MTPEERTERAKLGAHISWANTADPTARTEKARSAFEASFEKKVDPDGILPPDERARRAKHALQAHYAAMRLKSATTRRKKAAAKAAKAAAAKNNAA